MPSGLLSFIKMKHTYNIIKLAFLHNYKTHLGRTHKADNFNEF